MASRFARNSKHGGKRSGAGRPKKGRGPFKVVSLGQDTYEKLIKSDTCSQPTALIAWSGICSNTTTSAR